MIFLILTWFIVVTYAIFLAFDNGRNIRVEFVKEDCWVGVYWKTKLLAICQCGDKSCGNEGYYEIKYIYICLLPCLPIIITKYERK